MSDIIKINSIDEYCKSFGLPTLHPQVSIMDLSEAEPIRRSITNLGFYAVQLKDLECGNLVYGRAQYDYQEGTLVCIAPGQVIGHEDDGKMFQPTSHILAFHPDFIRGTILGQLIDDYKFFSYQAHEALHLSEREKEIVLNCLRQIKDELSIGIMDRHTKSLIIDQIKLLLDYSLRFYDRQFLTRENINKDVLVRFENIVSQHFRSKQEKELPSVQFIAQRLKMSPDYLSDLIKRSTGTSPLQYIHLKLIDEAKERLLDTTVSVSEVAYGLGFQHPQHFTRLFKKMVGMTPNEYRMSN